MNLEYRKTVSLLEAIWTTSPEELAKFRVRPIRRVGDVFKIYNAMSGDQYANSPFDDSGVVIDEDNFNEHTELALLEDIYKRVTLKQYTSRLTQAWLDNLYIMNCAV